MTDYSKIENDSRLIELLQNGDSAALNYILEKYKPLVIKNTKDFFLVGGDTEDLIQEGMIGLFSATRDYDINSEVSFFHFANLCIRRNLIKAIEADNRKKNSPLNDYVSISIDEGNSMDQYFSFEKDPAELIVTAEQTSEIILKLNDSLSEFERQVLKYYIAGLDYQEIAMILNKEPKDIDNAKSRIKTKAKKIL